MCGIAGYVGPTRRVDAAALLESLAPRGPDGQGTLEVTHPGWTGVLVHRRLAIIDPGPSGAQPRAAGQEAALVFNGEIFNHAELRESLRADGISFESRGDTEVLLRGLQARGEAFLEQLRGPFALAYLDRRAGTLLLARDRLGVNPLYVSDVPGGGFAFSSTVSALSAARLVRGDVDVRALCGLLFYGSVPEPLGLLRGVRELGPGRLLRVERDGRRVERTWWRLPPELGVGPQEALDRVRAALQDAVTAEQVSDVPVAVLLSSGLDSAAVAALAAREGGRPEAFTVGLPSTTGAPDESTAAAHTAQALGLRHRVVHAEAGTAASALAGALAAQDLPSMDGTNTWLVSSAIRAAGYKVALSGLGGDELFLGYANRANFRRMCTAPAIRAPSSWGHAATRLAPVLRVPARLERALFAAVALRGPAGAYAAVRTLAGPATVLSMVHPDLRGAVAPEDLDPTTYLDADHLPVDPDGALSRLELRNYLRSTLLKDSNQLSLAHGVELRVPMMDWRLVDTVLRIPGARRAAGAPPKPLLVEALRGILPEGIEKRPKLGFVLPLQQWLAALPASSAPSSVLSPAASDAAYPLALLGASIRAWEARQHAFQSAPGGHA